MWCNRLLVFSSVCTYTSTYSLLGVGKLLNFHGNSEHCTPTFVQLIDTHNMCGATTCWSSVQSVLIPPIIVSSVWVYCIISRVIKSTVPHFHIAKIDTHNLCGATTCWSSVQSVLIPPLTVSSVWVYCLISMVIQSTVPHFHITNRYPQYMWCNHLLVFSSVCTYTSTYSLLGVGILLNFHGNSEHCTPLSYN